MNISQIKHELLEWIDFYVQDIADIEAIKKAKTKKQLKAILKKHKNFLCAQNIVTMIHIDKFEKELFDK